MAMAKLVLFLFVLTFGKNPQAVQEFNQIKGEWVIVKSQMAGGNAPPNALPDKVSFVSAAEKTKQPAQSLAFTGKVDFGHTPKRLEFSSMSFTMADPPANGKAGSAKQSEPMKQQMKTFAIYQIKGDTMKLLIKPGLNPKTEPPKDFVTTKEGQELLLELKRKPK